MYLLLYIYTYVCIYVCLCMRECENTWEGVGMECLWKGAQKMITVVASGDNWVAGKLLFILLFEY